MKQKYKYAARISDMRGDREWQGTVVHYNVTQAKKLLKNYAKKKDIKGSIKVRSDIMKEKTNKKIGVY